MTKDYYKKFAEKHDVISEPVDLEGDELYRLADIIGS